MIQGELKYICFNSEKHFYSTFICIMSGQWNIREYVTILDSPNYQLRVVKRTALNIFITISSVSPSESRHIHIRGTKY